jgi:hypothetical protein
MKALPPKGRPRPVGLGVIGTALLLGLFAAPLAVHVLARALA